MLSFCHGKLYAMEFSLFLPPPFPNIHIYFYISKIHTHTYNE